MTLIEGFTVWLTGLPGSGKTTLARRLATVLQERGLRTAILDGEVVRAHLTPLLGFTKEDRDANVRWIGFACDLAAHNGVAAIAAAVSPYKKTRGEVRAKTALPFVEVFVDCSREVLVERNPKGLYAKALSGEIGHFSGISDPYEPPDEPEVIVRTDRETVEESLEKILRALEERRLIPPDEMLDGRAFFAWGL